MTPEQIEAKAQELYPYSGFQQQIFITGATSCQPEIDALKERVKELEAFAEDINSNWDCDTDAHRYNTVCRACEEKRLLTKPDSTGGWEKDVCAKND